MSHSSHHQFVRFSVDTHNVKQYTPAIIFHPENAYW